MSPRHNKPPEVCFHSIVAGIVWLLLICPLCVTAFEGQLFSSPVPWGTGAMGTDSGQPCTPPAPLDATVKPGSFAKLWFFSSSLLPVGEEEQALLTTRTGNELLERPLPFEQVVSSGYILSIQLMQSIKVFTPEQIKEVIQKPFTGSSNTSWTLTMSPSGFRTRYRIETV